MATRYKAKSGGKNPDLDLLDTMYDENEQVHTNRGARTATEASRGALDFYRLKAAPPVDLRSALVHALGPTLAAKVFGVSTKQAPADEIDQKCQQLADAVRRQSMTVGGDKSRALKWLDGLIAQVSGQQGSAGGSLGDNEKAMTKEARWANANNAFDAQLMGAAGAARGMTQGKLETDDALGMNNSPWYKGR